MILFKSRSNSRVQNLKFREFESPAIDREDFNSSTESTISTSLIHNIAIRGKIGTRTYLGFESHLPIHKDDGVVNLSN